MEAGDQVLRDVASAALLICLGCDRIAGRPCLFLFFPDFSFMNFSSVLPPICSVIVDISFLFLIDLSLSVSIFFHSDYFFRFC